MTRYYKNNENFFPQSESLIGAIHDKLPPGNYVIKKSLQGLYFEKYEKDFTMPARVYGDSMPRAKRIVDTFLSRPGGTGVLLSGEKGSGKTMLAKITCELLARDHGIPTIFVTQPWTGDDFLELIGNVDQPAVIFFDEFEKVYDGETTTAIDNDGDVTTKTSGKQGAILTLLDGVFTTQKLFFLTCNDKLAIDEHMINRPGRIYYAFEFSGLDSGFIREYCADNLKDGSRVDGITKVAGMFKHFSFDMLQALVEEVNRYGETPNEVLNYLNINPEYDAHNYEVQLFPAGLASPIEMINPMFLRSPFSKEGAKIKLYTYEMSTEYIEARASGKPFDAIRSNVPVVSRSRSPDNYFEFHFTVKDLRRSDDDSFELMNEAGDRLVLMKKSFSYDYKAF